MSHLFKRIIFFIKFIFPAFTLSSWKKFVQVCNGLLGIINCSINSCWCWENNWEGDRRKRWKRENSVLICSWIKIEKFLWSIAYSVEKKIEATPTALKKRRVQCWMSFQVHASYDLKIQIEAGPLHYPLVKHVPWSASPSYALFYTSNEKKNTSKHSTHNNVFVLSPLLEHYSRIIRDKIP